LEAGKLPVLLSDAVKKEEKTAIEMNEEEAAPSGSSNILNNSIP
jgi:hypothetical protein